LYKIAAQARKIKQTDHLSLSFTLFSSMFIPNQWTLEEVLALSLVPRMKAVDLRRLVEEYDSLTALLLAAPNELVKAKIFSASTEQDTLFAGSRSASSVYDALMQEAAAQMLVCKREDVQICSYWNEEYPALLKKIFYPPTLVYVRGDLQPSDAAAIAIVGTRHCTDYGRMVAEQYAIGFAQAGIVVVSGLATGIDSFAHKAAVKAGGTTYAVIASGIDCISPQLSAALANEISGGKGAIVSEYPCGMGAQRAYFPRRNRIITGISKGVVVVESGEKGGSLITARFALDENRELFAVPGRIYSERSKGTNLLIQRSEARLTLSSNDVLVTLGFAAGGAQSVEAAPELNPLERSIYNALTGDPIHIETLAERTNASVQDLLFVLLELEFRGLVRQMAGKQFMRLGT
jgi:DNA processing protein